MSEEPKTVDAPKPKTPEQIALAEKLGDRILHIEEQLSRRGLSLAHVLQHAVRAATGELLAVDRPDKEPEPVPSDLDKLKSMMLSVLEEAGIAQPQLTQQSQKNPPSVN